MTKKATHIATRGVSWRDGDGWVNREAGDDISDAPAAVLKDLASHPKEAPAAVSPETWAAMAMNDLATSGKATVAKLAELAKATSELKEATDD